jgi:D-alanine-D-alanine ligase
MDGSDEIFVLEYNPNPDISPDAGFIRSLKAGGYTYEDFVSIVLKEAFKRKGNG